MAFHPVSRPKKAPWIFELSEALEEEESIKKVNDESDENFTEGRLCFFFSINTESTATHSNIECSNR